MPKTSAEQDDTEAPPEGPGGAPERLQPAGSSVHCNEVRLVGRVSKPAVEREMPSGDVLVSFVCVVTRSPRPRAAAGRGPTHDSLDCVAWTAAARRAALRLRADDVVEVRGALRRRFWGAGAIRSSRYEVEATAIRRVARPRT